MEKEAFKKQLLITMAEIMETRKLLTKEETDRLKVALSGRKEVL